MGDAADEIFGPGNAFEDNGGAAVEIVNPLWLESAD